MRSDEALYREMFHVKQSTRFGANAPADSLATLSDAERGSRHNPPQLYPRRPGGGKRNRRAWEGKGLGASPGVPPAPSGCEGVPPLRGTPALVLDRHEHVSHGYHGRLRFAYGVHVARTHALPAEKQVEVIVLF